MCIAGCARRVSVSEIELSVEEDRYALPSERGDGNVFHGDYVFHLVDGSELSATKFQKTDSTFVVLQIFDGRRNVDIEPRVMPAENVAAIETSSMHNFPTALILTGLFIAVGFYLYLSAIFGGLN